MAYTGVQKHKHGHECRGREGFKFNLNVISDLRSWQQNGVVRVGIKYNAVKGEPDLLLTDTISSPTEQNFHYAMRNLYYVPVT